jgi:hypothetical protein
MNMPDSTHSQNTCINKLSSYYNLFLFVLKTVQKVEVEENDLHGDILQ